jgi:hypothetical protein
VKSTGIEGPSVWARRTPSLFVCFVILVFTASGSEPTETTASVSVSLSVGKYWRRRAEVKRFGVRELRFCMSANEL